MLECKLQEIMDHMFARMDQMKTNQMSHVDNNHQGTRVNVLYHLSVEFMVEKNILFGRWLSNKNLISTLCPTHIEFDKLLVHLKILPLFGGMG